MRVLAKYKKDAKIEKFLSDEEKEIKKINDKNNKIINKKLKVRHAVLNPEKGEKKREEKKRGRIKSFSKDTQKRIKFFMNNNEIEYKTMITLTYPEEIKNRLDGVEAKYHLNRFTKRFKLNNYVWVMEFQKNGNPHFHILTDIEIPNKKKNKKDFIELANEISKIWYEIVNSGLEKHLKAGVNIEFLRHGKEGASSYIRKYINKKEQKRIPSHFKNVGKLWGKGGEKSKKLEKELVTIDEEVIEVVKKSYIEEIEEDLIKKGKDGITNEMKEKMIQSKYLILWNYAKDL